MFFTSLRVNVGCRAAAVDGVVQSGSVLGDEVTLGMRRQPHATASRHSRRTVQLHSHRRTALFRYI